MIFPKIIESTDAETNSESKDYQFATPPKKKPRGVCGAAAYGTKHNSDWESSFLFISPGKQDKIYSFYCKVE